MAEKWQVSLRRSIVKKPGKLLYPLELPKLSKPADNDLKKQWSVTYGVWSETKQQLIRKRVIVKGLTVAERLAMPH